MAPSAHRTRRGRAARGAAGPASPGLRSPAGAEGRVARLAGQEVEERPGGVLPRARPHAQRAGGERRDVQGGDGTGAGEAQRDDGGLSRPEPRRPASAAKRSTRAGAKPWRARRRQVSRATTPSRTRTHRGRAGEGPRAPGRPRPARPTSTQGMRATSTSRSGSDAPDSMTRLSSESAATTTSAPSAELGLADGRRLHGELPPGRVAGTRGRRRRRRARPPGWPSRAAQRAPPTRGAASEGEQAREVRGSSAHLSAGSSAHWWSRAMAVADRVDVGVVRAG